MARVPLRHRILLACLCSLLLGLVGAGASPVASSGPEIRYRYEIAGRANSGSLEEFAGSVAETLADDRGWNLGGAIGFERVPGGGDFTVWLSAAGAVPTFGSACSSYYSCRVGRNVVINEDRWRSATPAWTSTGAGLRDYRHMVVNHEVGHWLGLGHASCGGSGQPAPVMQQQSKGLAGCAANPWPVDRERDAVARRRGVGVRRGTDERAAHHSLATDPEGRGYWILKGDGSVFGYGSVEYAGSAHGRLSGFATSMDTTPSGSGYRIAGREGSIFGFGDASSRYFGSPRDVGVTSGIVDLASTTPEGYWVLSENGSVFGFGDAAYHGSPRDLGYSGEAVALIPGVRGAGYWVAGADGSVFGFGDAADRYYGSPSDGGVRSGVVSMASTRSGEGYWVLRSDGSVFGYGDAEYHGSMHGQLEHPASAIGAATEGGYRILGRDGAVFTFGPAAYLGSAS